MRTKRRSIKEAAIERTLRGIQALVPAVTDVEDANSDVLIDVSKKDVAHASRKAHRSCALAEACKARTGVDAAIISRSMAYLVYGKKAVRYMLTGQAIKELVAFDRGGRFANGQYLLKAPSAGERMGARKSSGRRPGTGTEKPLRRYTFTRGIRSSLAGASK